MGTPDDDLETARHFLRQGLLADAAAALGRLPASATVSDQAAADLLSGNIAYERGDYGSAQGAWIRAAQLYAELEPGGEGQLVAQENLSLASSRLERQAGIGVRVHQVQLAVGLVALLALVAVAIAFRMSAGATGRRPPVQR